MLKDRVLEVLKGAVEVNLRYSAITLKLAKEYIKEFDGLVRDGVAGQTRPDGSPAAPPGERRPPILLVGRAGTEASGAFVLNNTADADLTVSLVVQGELGPVEANLVPESLIIAPADSAVVQIKVAIGDALETGRDYFGAVVAPGLSAQAVEFVVRRLPDETPPAPDRKGKATPRRAAG